MRTSGRQAGRRPVRHAAMALEHWVTLGTIAILVVGVVGFQVHVGMGAFAAAVVLTLAKVADEKPAILAHTLERDRDGLRRDGPDVAAGEDGGIDLFTTILARFATHRSVTGLIALVTGLISVYSSTSGVVLPAFLPSVPGLVAKLGGGNPLAIASSILIGGHLVDVSPLSTIGALCIASAPARGRSPAPVQPGAGLGTVDVGCRGGRVLPGLSEDGKVSVAGVISCTSFS